MDQKKMRNTSMALLRDDLTIARNRAKFEVYGEEMIEKEVKQSGNSGRVYLPPEWVGKHVKIIRIE
jgi:putative transposon-encoded protein